MRRALRTLPSRLREHCARPQRHVGGPFIRRRGATAEEIQVESVRIHGQPMEEAIPSRKPREMPRRTLSAAIRPIAPPCRQVAP